MAGVYCAQVSVAALSFVLGFVAVIGSYVMGLIPKTQALQKVLVHFFRVQPPFLLGEGLIELTRYNFEKDLAAARFGGYGTGSNGTSNADAAVNQQTGKRCLSVWKMQHMHLKHTFAH